MSKTKSPYALERDYWDSLPKDARKWMEKYSKAVEFGNFNALQELCADAPSENFDEIKSEVMYERDFYKRNQYLIPDQYNSRYTEWDYSWAAPSKCPNKRTLVDAAYAVENDDPEFYVSPTRKVNFK